MVVRSPRVSLGFTVGRTACSPSLAVARRDRELVRRVGAIIDPHVFFGVVGIIAVVIGVTVNIFPDAARKAVLKQPPLLSAQTAKRLYSRNLVRIAGIGLVVIGAAFIVQWVVSAGG